MKQTLYLGQCAANRADTGAAEAWTIVGRDAPRSHETHIALKACLALLCNPRPWHSSSSLVSGSKAFLQILLLGCSKGSSEGQKCSLRELHQHFPLSRVPEQTRYPRTSGFASDRSTRAWVMAFCNS